MYSLTLLQDAIRTRLTACQAVTDLVPADHIVDRGGRPEVFPCVILGEDQAVATFATLGPRSGERYRSADLYATLHIFTREGGLYGCKVIAAAVCDALHDELALGTHNPRNLYLEGERFMRDPDGVTSHGVLTFWMGVTEVIH